MDTQVWMRQFLETIQAAFGPRLVFAGLQGSRGRGEETETSDIDVVVVLDRLTLADLDHYRTAVAGLPNRALLCGFISGRAELAAWDRADLFQFYHDTISYYGDLEFLSPLIKEEDIRRAVHRGVCDVYHTCCHNYLHEIDANTLQTCCKSAFFILQAKYYLETGNYISRKTDLLRCLSGEDSAVLGALLAGDFAAKFSENTALLLAWAGELIRTI